MQEWAGSSSSRIGASPLCEGLQSQDSPPGRRSARRKQQLSMIFAEIEKQTLPVG